ncbi:MAG: tetratricopeptide repeat protein [Rhizobiaceae bacterium]
MRISEYSVIRLALMVGLCGLATLAQAGDKLPKGSPWEVFQFGFSAYQRGDKAGAVEAYRYAAENGQIGAQWKLARMYAEGDGIPRDDYEAFRVFSTIAEMDVQPGSPEESYVSDALLAMGRYLKKGIPGTSVKANQAASREYLRAAAGYGNADAQFELGRMFLAGEGVKQSARQAGQWLQLAASKGHAGAQALLGNLLYQKGKIVRGLAMMTSALSRAKPADQNWIRPMQEEAFSLAAEVDRRQAMDLSDGVFDAGD